MTSRAISISETAKRYGLISQTITYYDTSNLIKLIHLTNNNFRYCSPRQAPFLREIFFFKKWEATIVFIDMLKGND